MLSPLTDLFARDGFDAAVLLGLAFAVPVALVALATRRVLPLAGLAFGAAAVLALDDRYTVEPGVVTALAVLAAGGLVADALAAGGLLAERWAPVAYAAGALPGAVLLTGATEVETPDWARPALAGVTVVGGALVAAFDRSHGHRGLPPVLLAVTAFGAYVTTPDTEHTALVLGAALPVALLGWPRPLASLGVGGSLVATALVSWNVAVDGVGRPGAIVGGLACLGMFAVAPVVGRVTRRADADVGDDSLLQALLVAGLHVVLVAVCSRVAGLRDAAPEALVICAVAYAAAAALLVWGTRRLDGLDATPTASGVAQRGTVR